MSLVPVFRINFILNILYLYYYHTYSRNLPKSGSTFLVIYEGGQWRTDFLKTIDLPLFKAISSLINHI